IMPLKAMSEARMHEVIREQVAASMVEFMANINRGAGGDGAGGARVGGDRAGGAGAGGAGAGGAGVGGAGVGLLPWVLQGMEGLLPWVLMQGKEILSSKCVAKAGARIIQLEVKRD
ncbi:hypothetical protein Tco_0274823, partial [Tanacetum coccineum]